MKNKIFKYIWITIRVCVILFFLAFALVICLQRFSNNSISIFNYRMFSVATGSMVPKYNIGDVILCKEVDASTLKVGDDISYIGETASYKGKVVTHRIIKIDKDEDGKLLFQTKGIATQTTDPIVKEEQIYGKIVMEIGILSSIYKFMSTPNGFYISIFIPLAILIGSEIIISMVEKFEDKRKKQTK